MENKRKVMVYGNEVLLDTSKLAFSEATLDEYLETEGGWIDYFGAKLADAERQLAEAEMAVEREEDEYERIYAVVFSTASGTVKAAENQTKIDPTVVAAKNKVLDMTAACISLKHTVNMLRQHLRAWDKNHENAQNRGNTLRKEMERLHKDRVLVDNLEDIIKSVDAQPRD